MEKVYIVMAADADEGDVYALDVHAAATEYDIAQAIIDKDTADGQIISGVIVPLKLYSSIDDI